MRDARSVGVVAFMTVLAAAGCNVVGSAAQGHRRFEMPSEAMQPAIRRGQVVEARPVHSGKYSPRRGDIVVFVAPDWNQSQPDTEYLKRVIAIGGDKIRCCSTDGRVMLNGAVLSEPYVAKPDKEAPFGPVTVAQGRLWVMGDNRMFSSDSRRNFAGSGDGTIAATSVTDVVILPH
jgi:signal peptidase I